MSVELKLKNPVIERMVRRNPVWRQLLSLYTFVLVLAFLFATGMLRCKGPRSAMRLAVMGPRRPCRPALSRQDSLVTSWGSIKLCGAGTPSRARKPYCNKWSECVCKDPPAAFSQCVAAVGNWPWVWHADWFGQTSLSIGALR